MTMHFVEGFLIATLMCCLWGQFPSSGHPFKAMVSRLLKIIDESGVARFIAV